MAHTVETIVYPFAELDDSAKERARQWFIEHFEVDTDSVYDHAATAAGYIGIDFATARHGSPRPAIFWSGFWNQGDGACFEGTYKYGTGAVQAIKTYAPADKELLRIAEGLQAVQKRFFYQLTASMSHTGRGNNSGNMSVSVEDARDSYRDIGEAEDTVKELMRDFADWIYSQIEDDYKNATSDESVDEMITCNGYTFTANGEIF